MAPDIVPLVMIREARLVRQDGPRSWTPLFRTAEESVVAIRAQGGRDSLTYVYDVDGVEAHAADHSFYQRLEQAHVQPWIDAGCRKPEDVMDAFMAGAQAVTVQARLMTDETMRDLADIAEGEMHLGLRFDGRAPDPQRSIIDLQRWFREMGATGVVIEAGARVDWRALEIFAAELRRQGVPTTLLLFHDSPFLGLARTTTAFDRVAMPSGARP